MRMLQDGLEICSKLISWFGGGNMEAPNLKSCLVCRWELLHVKVKHHIEVGGV